MNRIKILKNSTILYLSLIILLSLTFTFYSGYRGIFPIDSFLIFDAGFKILNGYQPFKDYWSITGPFLDYFQYLFFKMFGVNWTSYVLHAGTINIILSLATFYFFLNIGLKKVHSCIYSISIAILGYPSVGTPFMDHHASIFSLLSLMTLILALKKDHYLYWFSLPLLLGFSFFSKQIPSVYLSILFLIIILIYLAIKKFRKISNVTYLLYGFVTLILICSSVIITNDIPTKNILTQYIFYPISIGKERSLNLNLNFNNIFSQFKFIYFSLLPLIFPIYYLIKIKVRKYQNSIDILILFTLLLSVLIFLYSQLITKNQILIFFIIPFCLGMAHYYIINYCKNKKLIYLLFFIIIISTLKFHIRFNIDKKFMELSGVDFSLAQPGEILDQKLSGLKWITPNYKNNPKKELLLLLESKNKIIKEKKTKILITDYQILPSITKTLKFAPNKWFDDLSVPSKENKYFNTYKKFFEKKIIEQSIQVIFIVGKNKSKYLINHFTDERCISQDRINEIMLKLNIEKCKFKN